AAAICAAAFGATIWTGLLNTCGSRPIGLTGTIHLRWWTTAFRTAGFTTPISSAVLGASLSTRPGYTGRLGLRSFGSLSFMVLWRRILCGDGNDRKQPHTRQR